MECQQCGREYDRLGHHWSQSKSCSIPDFTDHQYEILTGSLMGDGTLDVQDGRNPRITVAVGEEEYVKYLEDQLRPLCGEVYQGSGVWWISTRNSPYLTQYNSWYSSRDKSWPEDLEITPIVLKHLYAQDGSTQFRSSPIARICTTNEQADREKVSSMIENAGLPSPTWDDKQFRWTVEESKEVFEYMGDSVPGYEYKWP